MRIRTLLGYGLMAIGLTVAAAEDDGAKMIADNSDDGAAEMIAAIEAIKPPILDSSRRDDQDYVQAIMKEQKACSDKRGELAKEFYRKFPSNPYAFKYLYPYWHALTMAGHVDAALADIDQLLADHPTAGGRTNLLYSRAMTVVNNGSRTGSMTAAAAAIDEFIKEFPKDPRGGALLLSMVNADRDSPHEAEILKRIVENYGDTPPGVTAKGKLRQTEGIGNPVELSFDDAVSGKPISLADLKGKIVVLDFWATWCVPCVAEMPTMKELYAEYKDKGVEFIGISLDNPPDGLAKLKEFVAKKDIPWPQYYQGEGFRSAFSNGWGISSIPCVFVIDAESNLYSTDARGKLAKTISTLLARR